MCPVIEPADRVPARRVVPRDLTPARFQERQYLLANARRPDGIEENLDRQAGARALDQGGRDLFANFSVPIDVGLNRDGVLRVANRLEHRRIEFVAVVENRHVVPGDRHLACRADHRGQELRVGDPELVVEPELRRSL